MDYTTLARTKAELHAQTSTDDTLLGQMITAASRAIDRKCTGVPDGLNYFLLENVVNERLEGLVDYQGSTIYCYPHKPLIYTVASFTFQENISKPAYTVDPSLIWADGPRVQAYPANMPLEFPSRCLVTISYYGGLAQTVSGSGTDPGLPDDLQEVTTLLAIRFYREAETGVTDQIGVAELSTMSYTKSWPTRAEAQIQAYIRRVGWRHIA